MCAARNCCRVGGSTRHNQGQGSRQFYGNFRNCPPSLWVMEIFVRWHFSIDVITYHIHFEKFYSITLWEIENTKLFPGYLFFNGTFILEFGIHVFLCVNIPNNFARSTQNHLYNSRKVFRFLQ